LLPEPPLPVSAVFDLAAKLLTVTFDHVLQSSTSIDVANWTFVQNPTTKFAGTLPGVAAGNAITVTLDSIVPVGLQAVGTQYAPPPFDVIATNALTAAAFTAFPTTVV
jgi:hypothetical protein